MVSRGNIGPVEICSGCFGACLMSRVGERIYPRITITITIRFTF